MAWFIVERVEEMWVMMVDLRADPKSQTKTFLARVQRVALGVA